MHTIGADTGRSAPATRGPAVRQRRRLALRGARRQVARGREFAREALRDWGWDGGDTAEDALLVVSELVTNANLHADGCHELTLRGGDVFRIEVHDGVGELPRLPSGSRPGTPGGHGLQIVRRLADDWGAERHAHGKVVWAEIDAARLRADRPLGGREL
ncbi:ATP-binding protein [Streptomyces sp. NPDC089922]|uniref:ATP-binding protein n=1 Tax=unclassified Streptomyces TaxID=2593676 RepID=UPI00341E2B99